MKAIYFDMDGTIADLYGRDGWLDDLMNEYTRPYREAKPLVDMRALGRELNRLKDAGYIVGVVSWLAKGATEDYNRRIAKAKREWLAKHIGAVEWDEIHIVAYGTPKHEIVADPMGILFDDEKPNRIAWDVEGLAFDTEHIIEVLKAII